MSGSIVIASLGDGLPRGMGKRGKDGPVGRMIDSWSFAGIIAMERVTGHSERGRLLVVLAD